MYTHASESSRLISTSSRWSLAIQDTSPSPVFKSTDNVTIQDLVGSYSDIGYSNNLRNDIVSIELDAKFEEVSLTSPYLPPASVSPSASRRSLGRGLPSTLRRSGTARRTSCPRRRNEYTDARSPSYWMSPSPIACQHVGANKVSPTRRAITSPVPNTLAGWRQWISFALCGTRANSRDAHYRRVSSKELITFCSSSDDSCASSLSEEHESSFNIPSNRVPRRSARRSSSIRQQVAPHRQARRASRSTPRPMYANSPPRHDELEWMEQYCSSPETTIRAPHVVGLGFCGSIDPDFTNPDQGVSLNDTRRRLEAAHDSGEERS